MWSVFESRRPAIEVYRINGGPWPRCILNALQNQHALQVPKAPAKIDPQVPLAARGTFGCIREQRGPVAL